MLTCTKYKMIVENNSYLVNKLLVNSSQVWSPPYVGGHRYRKIQILQNVLPLFTYYVFRHRKTKQFSTNFAFRQIQPRTLTFVGIDIEKYRIFRLYYPYLPILSFASARPNNFPQTLRSGQGLLRLWAQMQKNIEPSLFTYPGSLNAIALKTKQCSIYLCVQVPDRVRPAGLCPRLRGGLLRLHHQVRQELQERRRDDEEEVSHFG